MLCKKFRVSALKAAQPTDEVGAGQPQHMLRKLRRLGLEPALVASEASRISFDVTIVT